ncbi:hypothetical protein ACIQVK_19365 [Streptomyces sp. NPDC090493]|uniref:hypothetical protein n=1 Tax=Streptomyces sp. NPDC090493 TaxID=3365964 RepID=UPI0037F2029B
MAYPDSVEINGQVFSKGDTVLFPLATLAANRTRDYRITWIWAEGIAFTTDEGFAYECSHTVAARIGITHTEK